MKTDTFNFARGSRRDTNGDHPTTESPVGKEEKATPTLTWREDVRRLVREEAVQLVEVLSPPLLENEHIESAVNIWLEEIDRETTRDLDKDRPVVASGYRVLMGWAMRYEPTSRGAERNTWIPQCIRLCSWEKGQACSGAAEWRPVH